MGDIVQREQLCLALRVKTETDEMYQLAVDHYRVQQQRTCIALLKWNVQRVHHKVHLALKADMFHNRQVLASAWRRWCAVTEAVLELKQAPLCQRAVQHYGLVQCILLAINVTVSYQVIVTLCYK